MARKTSAKRAVTLVPQPHGGALQHGNPGNKGGGRKPDLFYERARELANDPTVWKVQMAMAQAGNLKPLELAAHYTYGKPPDTVKHDGEITVRVIYDGD